MLKISIKDKDSIFLRSLFGLILGTIMLGQISIMAITILDGTTPAGFAPGSPAGSYALSNIESVNLFNGNLNFTLPLLKSDGRGGADSGIVLPIASRWTNFYDPGIFNQDGSPRYFNPTPKYNWSPYMQFKPGYGPGTLLLRGEDILIGPCNDGQTRQNRYRLTFTAQNGTEFELRDTIFGGAPLTYQTGPPACNNGPLPSRGRTFITADGTAATFVSDSDIPVYSGFSANWQSRELYGILSFRDGTQYRVDNGLVTWIRDRNGNTNSYAYTNDRVTLITNSIGRQTTIEYGVNDVAPYGLCDRITFKGVGGQVRIIRVSYSQLGETLAPGFSLKTLDQLFPPLSPNNGPPHSQIFNGGVVSSVWLPDDGATTRRYRFFYNSYSEIARVELPTGGAYEYDWEGGAFDRCNIRYPQGEILRRVKERRVINENALMQTTRY